MYVRITSLKNRDGSTVTYLQLAHNVWNKEKVMPLKRSYTVELATSGVVTEMALEPRSKG